MSRPKIDIDKFREKWLATRNISESLIYAGGSPVTAKRGYSGLNKKCKLIVDGKEVSPPSDDEISALMQQLKTPEDISNYVRGKIIRAIELGESPKNLEGHLKLLGTLKEHNIFEAKKSNEIFVIAPSCSMFDDLDHWDIQPIVEMNGGVLNLSPVPSEKLSFVDKFGNRFLVKIHAPTNEKFASA